VEILPGIHRIESDLGPRFMCQYLLRGTERTVLVDTGLAATPEAVLARYLDGVGSTLDEIDDVIVSHADADHCGGNRALRARHPRARFACHELDRRWIESNRTMLAENYSWYEPYGFGPDEETKEAVLRDLGGDAPIDVGLAGGETLRLGPDWRIEILHLPGHTPGHLGVRDPRSGAVITIDAVLERGIYDRAGNRLIPPRYYDVRDYRRTIGRIRLLQPSFLLTAHYPVMERDDAVAFLDRSLAFTQELDEIVHAGVADGVTDLRDLARLADERLGPYPDFAFELGASVRAHLARIGPP
jgi:glyoxylase-like metal-dependent hydrolase (beta-lactamase superfamily II)